MMHPILTKRFEVPKLSVAQIELGLLATTLLWCLSGYMFFASGKSPMGWYCLLAFVPGLSAVLAFAPDRGLKAAGRPMKYWEILLVIVVTPQFPCFLFFWWALFHSLGFIKDSEHEGREESVEMAHHETFSHIFNIPLDKHGQALQLAIAPCKTPRPAPGFSERTMKLEPPSSQQLTPQIFRVKLIRTCSDYSFS